jgi:hypothetical protein
LKRLAFAVTLMLSTPLAASLAQAAEPTPIRLGHTITAELSEGDRTEPDGSYFDVYAFDGKAGEQISIDMRSKDVDSVLALYVEGQQGPIGINNDADRRGHNAKLDFVLPKDGHYLIVANAALPGETGAYRLTVNERKPIVEVRPSVRKITPGRAVQAALGERSGRAGDDSRYDLYRFHGKAGEAIRVSLSSNDFEPFVSLHAAGEKTELSFARDHGQRSAELRAVLPADGDYEIWANTATPGETGRYALWLGRDGEGAAPPARPIAFGDTVFGELTAGDGKARDDSLYDAYRFKASRGDEVSVTMRSPMVESYLIVRRQGDERPLITASDDGFGGRDAELTFVAPADGVYEVWANTLSAGQRGDYVISLEKIGRHTGEVARNP